MLDTVTNTGNLKPIQNVAVKNNYNPQFKGNNDSKLERVPECDKLEKEGVSTAGIVGLSLLGITTVAAVADLALTKGKNIKNLFNKASAAVTKIVAKYKKTDAATEVVEKATDSMTTKETTEKVIDAVKEQTAKAKVKGVGRKELDEIVENELREKGYSQAHVQYKEKLTKVQRKAIRENNKKVREIHSKAHQIGEKAKGAEKLQEVLNPKTAVEPALKPIVEPANEVLNQQVKSIEGQIKVYQQRIAGAKKFGKDTSKLDKELANLQAKLAEIKK